MRCRFTLPLKVIVCLTSLAVGGCQRHPNLVDRLGTPMGDPQSYLWGHDVRELAPIIVVASVEENHVVAKHVEATQYPGVYLDLHAVRCKRENSLKGELAELELRFFYFADGKYPDSKPNPIYGRLFSARPGARYLFFLTRDRGVLRSIGDVGDYSILVSTGSRPEASTKGNDIGKLVSEVLLTPGDGADLDLMGMELFDYSRIADIWGSRLLSAKLLRRLISLPEPMRSKACGVLAASYLGQDDCIKAIAEDASEPAQRREAALGGLKEQTAPRQRLLDTLKDPAMPTYLCPYGDGRRRMREELETILLGTDTPLRERACTALKRYYPYDAEPGCSGEKKREKPGQ